MRIGVAACGYADGYPRLAPGDNELGTPVLVDGVRTRTVGRVSMDMITVDLGPVPTATIGSEVVLWGRASTGAVLSIDDVAAAAGNGRLRADVRARAARAGARRVLAMGFPIGPTALSPDTQCRVGRDAWLLTAVAYPDAVSLRDLLP